MTEPQAAESLPIAVAVVSDTRTTATDRSGRYLAEVVEADGHRVVAQAIVTDDRYRIRGLLAPWIADPAIGVILVTGGTGLAAGDVTPEAVAPLLDRRIDGFGEAFRRISEAEIGSATLQSRAFAGLANQTLVCCLPGSSGACRSAWEGLLREQLDSRHRPCNLAQLVAGGEAPTSA